MAAGQARQEFELDLLLAGDVRVVFFDHDGAYESSVGPCGLGRRRYPASDSLCFFFWLHTGFVRTRTVRLTKEEVDVACHDRACRVFENEFAVDIHFDMPSSENGSLKELKGDAGLVPMRKVTNDTARSCCSSLLFVLNCCFHLLHIVI